MEKDFQRKKRQALELLKLHYGFTAFRPGQEKAIDSALLGRDALVIMPTGGGKSLCYQLPSLVLEGVTLVISPLIALMKDQVDGLEAAGVPATLINSTISPQEAEKRMDRAAGGEVKIMYVAPERFYNQEFLKAIGRIKVGLFAVDEAHCISEWGHDFRPAYLKLRQAVDLLGRPPVMALTATATPEVREDIVGQLGLNDHKAVITGFARPNLQFGVIQAKDAEKLNYLLKSVEASAGGSGIIYTGTRAKADEIANFLLSRNIPAIVYHAGMRPEDRKWVQENFMQNKVKIIVATNAFGLGIDKRDIRFVIHYDLPGTVEAYYQEAGRAGRDGQPSLCLLFYQPRDRYLREFFIKGDNPPPETILELYELLKSYGSDKILVTYSELRQTLGQDIPDMAVGTSLKILESAGMIGRTRERSGEGYLMLLEDTDKIRAAVPKRSKVQRDIIDRLERFYKKDIYRGMRFVADELASSLGIKKESLARFIHKLSGEGKIEYHPPFKGTEIDILARVDREDVPLDHAGLKIKLKNAYEKLDRMEEYACHYQCRQRFILEYFGETGTEDCGKCDNCLNGFRREVVKKDEPRRRRKFAGSENNEANLEVDTEYSKKSRLATKLTQLETYDLYKQGLGIEEIAKKRGLTAGTIVSHLCYLIESGKDIDAYKFIGKEKIGKVWKALEKTGSDKLKPIKEDLGDEDISYDEIRLALALKKAVKH